MKRALLLLLFIILSLPLMASLKVDYNFISSSDVSFFVSKLKKTVDPILGDKEEEIKLLSYEDNILTLSLFGKEERVIIDKEMIDESIKAVLYYNDYFSSSDPKLDYIYYDNYSSLSLLEKGKLYYLKSLDDRVLSLFQVRKVSDVSILSPIYKRSLIPGLKLEKTTPYLFSFYFKSGLKELTPSFDIKVSNLLYTLKLSYDVARSYFNTSLGIKAMYILSHFNGVLSADAYVSLGYDNSFTLGSSYELIYSTFLNEHIAIDVGYENSLDYSFSRDEFIVRDNLIKIGVSYR